MRELQNTAERALIIAKGGRFEAPDIILPDTSLELPETFGLQGTLKQVSLRAQRIVEKQKIEKALAEADFNKTKAARVLDISYKTLLNKIKEYGIPPSR